MIYYSGDELPRTQDLGGAEAGTIGPRGGEEAHHRTQTIKIARGGSLVPQVVDAPNLKLPSSRDAVANLLAIQAESRTSACRRIALHSRCAQSVDGCRRARSERGSRLHSQWSSARSVIAPAPSVTRDRPTTAPNFNATLIPPAPSVSSSHTLVAPALGPAVIPPAPSAAREHGLHAPMLSPSVVAPAPTCRSRTKPLHSRARCQRDSARARWGQPGNLQLTGANDQCGGGAAAGLGARTSHRAQFETKFAGALCRRTAAFRGYFARYAPSGGRKYSRPIEGGCPSAPHAIGQRIVHEQPDGKTFWCF